MTQFLDLDQVAADTEFSIKLDNKSHPLVLATVDDFVENTKMINTLKLDSTVEDEMNVIMQILQKSFPTVAPGRLGKLNMPQLKALREFAMNAGAERAVKIGAGTNEAQAEGNVKAS